MTKAFLRWPLLLLIAVLSLTGCTGLIGGSDDAGGASAQQIGNADALTEGNMKAGQNVPFDGSVKFNAEFDGENGHYRLDFEQNNFRVGRADQNSTSYTYQSQGAWKVTGPKFYEFEVWYFYPVESDVCKGKDMFRERPADAKYCRMQVATVSYDGNETADGAASKPSYERNPLSEDPVDSADLSDHGMWEKDIVSWDAGPVAEQILNPSFIMVVADSIVGGCMISDWQAGEEAESVTGWTNNENMCEQAGGTIIVPDTGVPSVDDSAPTEAPAPDETAEPENTPPVPGKDFIDGPGQ